MGFHVLGRWRIIGARVLLFVLWFIFAVGLLSLMMILSCSRPAPFVPPLPTVQIPTPPHTFWGIPLPGGHTAPAPAAEQQPPADIGTEAAKRSIATWATWIGRMGYFTVAAGILLGIFSALRGGLSLGRPLGVAAVGTICLFARFFLLAHGYFVSESISWALMLALFAAMAIGVWMLGHWLWERRTGIKLAEKRVAEGVVGVDAVAMLPVGQKTRRKLASAWHEFVSDEPVVPTYTPSLFRRHSLPVPKSGG
jgi:hypothetical protein